MKPQLTHERLLALVTYDPQTGIFRWRKDMKGGCRAGEQVGYVDDLGYWRTSLDGARHRLHRVAWFYMHGAWPDHDIDHINGIRSDNRIANLRDVPRRTNLENLRNTKGGAAGLLGVTPRDKKFIAQIRAHGKGHYLGRYATAEEAHAAYVEAKRRLHEGNTL